MGPSRLRVDLLMPAVVVLVVLSPMLLTVRGFDPDWFNHLWLVREQRDAIGRGGFPSLFTHTDGLGTYYPQFAFYGGTLYAATGYLSWALAGSAVWAYVASFAAGLGMAYGGWSWLARQAGIGGWRAHVPGLVHVTSAYVLTNAYARGTWPELMATSALPLVVAGAVWLVRAPAWRPGPVAAWVVAVTVFTGSHNLTLAWGTVFLVLVALAFAVGLGRAVLPPAPRLAAIAALGLLAVAVNAWFLVPDLAYSGRVAVDAYVTGAPQLNTIAQVLSPLRPTADGLSTPALHVQMPVLALGWALLAAALCVRGRWARLAGALLVLLAGFLVLVLRDDATLERLGAPGVGAWRHLPQFLTYVQFAYRLQTYVTLLVCGLVLVGLRAAAGRRGLDVALAAIAVWSVGLAAWQVWDVPGRAPQRTAVYDVAPGSLPPTWSDPGNFQDRTRPLVRAGGRPFGPTPGQAARGERVAVPGGARVATVTGGPYLVRAEGATVVGRTERNRSVLGPGAREVRFSAARTFPVVVGRWLSAAALLALLALAAWGRSRPRGRPAAAVATAASGTAP